MAWWGVLHQGRAVRGGVRAMTRPAWSMSRATVEDAETIADLHVRSWRFAYADFLPADYLAALDVAGHALRYWQPALTNERRNSSTHVASVEGVPAGFVSIEGPEGVPPPEESLPGHGYVHHIHVAPEHLGTGVGAGLWRFAMRAMQARGFHAATLAVYEPNHRARTFYERMGWTADGWSMPRAFPSAGGEVSVTMVRYHGSTMA